MDISFFSSSFSFSYDDIKNKAAELSLIHKHNTDLGLYLLKYDKKKSNMNDDDVKKCRGVIAEIDTNRLICVPPTKSLDLPTFCNMYQNWSDVKIEEFIDGTMINYFYHKNEWILSTRSKIGGYCNWYSDKTFNELFHEATQNINLENLNKNYFYSFVLIHPDNRIVSKYDTPNIVLVSMGKINENNTVEYLDIHDKNNVTIDITLPKVYNFNNILEIHDKVNTLDYNFQGYVLKIKNGIYRSKIRNEKYNYVKFLRGNTNDLKFMFFELFQSNYHKEYLRFFPEEQNNFESYEKDFLNLVKNIFYSYKSYHVNKTVKDIKQIPYKYRPLCYEIHGLYKQFKKPITYNTVYSYLIGLPVKRIIFTLEPLN